MAPRGSAIVFDYLTAMAFVPERQSPALKLRFDRAADQGEAPAHHTGGGGAIDELEQARRPRVARMEAMPEAGHVAGAALRQGSDLGDNRLGQPPFVRRTVAEARLQLNSYSQPMMEMAVASSRSPTGALAAGKHGVGMLSIGGTSDDALKAHASNWGVYEATARKYGHTPDRRKWRMVTFAHVAETREEARADVKFGLDNFRRYFTEVGTFPIIPPDITGDPAEYLVSSGMACIVPK